MIHEPVPIRSVPGVGMLPGIAYAFPAFNINDVVTQVGEQRVNLIIKGLVGVALQALYFTWMDSRFFNLTGWIETQYLLVL